MLFIDAVALYAILAIWLVMAIHAALSVGGFLYYLRVDKTGGRIPLAEYPMVSVLVPAHNEAIVIQRTVESLLRMDYPPERCEIIVINDHSSDHTEEILIGLQQKHPHRRLLTVSTTGGVGGRGKSAALNIGLAAAGGSVLAIYDADNTPQRDALLLLVENLMADDSLGAVIGKFRTRNKTASLLTRFVNIETLAYQCMNQAGRYFFFGLCTIPGTNFVIRRSLIEGMGGWDENALSEDTEISFQIYRMGYQIKQMPLAVTWEQEPHLLPVWFRQRTRWSKGNLYVLLKNFKYAFDPTAGRMRLDVFYYALIYVLMLSSLICSDIIFLLGILGFAQVTLGGFSTLLWILAIAVFVMNILLTLATEKNEFSFTAAALILLMLFTYSKLWVVVVANGIRLTVSDRLLGRETVWDKTVRYEETGA